MGRILAPAAQPAKHNIVKLFGLLSLQICTLPHTCDIVRKTRRRGLDNLIAFLNYFALPVASRGFIEHRLSNCANALCQDQE